MLKRFLFPAILIALLALLLTERTLRPARSILGWVIYPISRPITELTQISRSIISSIKEISSLRSEAQRLKDENRILSAKAIELEALKNELTKLENALNFSNSHTAQKLIPARVIGRSPTRILQSIEIDKGEADGITDQAPVISDGFLVGTVIRRTAHRSTVRLITSSDSLIAVVFTNSRGQGLLKGGLDGLIVTKVPLDADVIPDEPLVTSGLGGLLPTNIPVGLAKEVRTIPSDILKEIRVNSPIAFSRLEMVFVGATIP